MVASSRASSSPRAASSSSPSSRRTLAVSTLSASPRTPRSSSVSSISSISSISSSPVSSSFRYQPPSRQPGKPVSATPYSLGAATKKPWARPSPKASSKSAVGSVTKVRQTVVLPKKPATVPVFPNEIFLAVLEFLPNERLLVLRCISKRFQALVDLILAYRLERNLIDLKLRRGLAQNRYTQSEVSKRPHLRHYGTFLRNVNPHSIIEASWYTMPPAELKTICECLVILKEGTAPDNEDLTSVSWTTTKRIMGRYSFKAWLTNIRLNVNHIAFENVKRVERIIMLDPNITYERVRGVSTTGYNLLIIVAACLQYCSIAKDLKDLEKVIQRLDLSIENARSFLRCLYKDKQPSLELPRCDSAATIVALEESQ